MTTTHQVAITIVARVIPGALAELKATLAGMSADPAASAIPFRQLDGMHFARLMIIPPPGPRGGEGHSLAFILDCDAPARARLRQLVTTMGPGLDAVLESCEGYPREAERSPRARLAYLRSHSVPAATYYVNTVGRSLKQIQQEALLREEIEHFLDGRAREWPGQSATSVRAEIQRFVQGRGALRWALQSGVPYVVVLVELPDAANIRMVGNLLGDPKEDVAIGSEVEAVFEDHNDADPPFTLVQWRRIG